MTAALPYIVLIFAAKKRTIDVSSVRLNYTCVVRPLMKIPNLEEV